MQTVQALVMPAWLESASSSQQFFTMSLPVLVAALMVFAASVLWEPDPQMQVQALMLADQRQLGYRRFTPARRWFSAFTRSLVETQSVVQSDPADADLIDLETLDAESVLLNELGTYAESEEVRNLQGLVKHFRREVLLEAGNQDQPGLAETWVGYGVQRVVGVGPLAESETHLRIYNANDLGHQLIARTITRGIGTRGLGLASLARTVTKLPSSRKWSGQGPVTRFERPVAFLAASDDEPTASELEATLVSLANIQSAGERPERLLRALLDAGQNRSVQAATSEELVERIQEHSRHVATRGESRVWSSDEHQTHWHRSWTSTTVISAGRAAEFD